MTDTASSADAPPEGADDENQPPAAPAAVTKIPYATINAGWLNLFAPLVVVSLVLSLVALVVALNADGGGTAAPAAPAADATGATTLDADLGEWFFTFDSPAIAGNTAVDVTFTNSGSVEHNFAVLREGVEPSNESLLEDDMVLTDLGDIAPGETMSGTLELEPATYLVVCLIAGHYDSGMAAPLTVVES